MNIPSKNLNTIKPSKYFMKFILSCFFALLFISFISSNAYAENVPDWVKNTAGWWSTDAISENEFVNAIEFLINEEIMIIGETANSKTSENVPDWVKNTAGWWSTDAISENEFISSIEWLISNGIIVLENKHGLEKEDLVVLKGCNKTVDKDGDNIPDNLDVQGYVDWSNCLLEGRDLSHRDLSNANLSGANLYGAQLDNTNLSGADLSYSNLYKVDLANTDLTKADLSYANMCGATNPVVKIEWPGGTSPGERYLIFDFTDTDLSYADFDHAQIQEVVLTNAIVKYTNFHDSDLSRADLSNMDLTGTILTKANLSGADLSGVDLSGKDLTGTILTGADLSYTNL
ncbi:MAG: pentapeptide repeat-containing protein, partial [Candidatus Nitrosopelagicus sp.]|nr:pentapeptide repeat-containing protein [Candidatus Nitrosopelagicus sp.]